MENPMIPNDKTLMSIQFKLISGGCVEWEMQSNAKWLPNDFIAKIHRTLSMELDIEHTNKELNKTRQIQLQIKIFVQC